MQISKTNPAAWKIRDEIIQRYIVIEGGKVHIKDDLGGLTYVGGMLRSTLEENRDLWDDYGYNGVGDPSLELTIAIFVREYWDKAWLDNIALVHPDLAETIYGWGINSGMARPVKVLQQHLNVMNLKGARYKNIIDDGFMGKNTMRALDAYLRTCADRRPLVKLCESITNAQWTFYLEAAHERKGEANETFIDGWFNRVLDKKERLELV